MRRRKFIQLGTAGAGAYSLLSCSAEQDSTITGTVSLSTPLCELLQIRHPIIQAGMADVAGPELVAAVSNAGGLGILSATMVPPEVLIERIRHIRELTNKPFGVNLILHRDLHPPADFDIPDETVQAAQKVLNGFRQELGMPESRQKPPRLPPLIQAAYELILQEKIPVFSIGLGNPSREMVRQCHDQGIKVMAMVCTLEDALAVQANGVDIVVAQGSEAGGHRSTWEKKPTSEYAAIGTLPLTAAVAASVDIPVVAAGGIVNGKGLQAALALGAQGVLLGTRFIATHESMAPESYKQRLLESSSDQTKITDVFTGMYARVLRNRFTETYEASQTPVLPPGRQYAATIDIVKTAGQKEQPDLCALYAGQGIDQINEVKPAAMVIEEIVQEALT